jgi:hypothetical protein
MDSQIWIQNLSTVFVGFVSELLKLCKIAPRLALARVDPRTNAQHR